jgi:NAD(P)-dependent dehydrogenase (short-subunit alcohol dehydrogenase family)
MQAKGGGAIVNVGSVNGLSTFGDPAYSAAKAGMVSLTQSMAMEYGRYGIRVNIVCPGTVRTPIWQHRVDREPEILTKLGKWYPLGRVADPIDIAKAVGFLASDDAAAITGVVLPVDCGLTAGNIVMTRELTLEDF